MGRLPIPISALILGKSSMGSVIVPSMSSRIALGNFAIFNSSLREKLATLTLHFQQADNPL
jgi:hypothetical protein